MDWLIRELNFLIIDDSSFTRKLIRTALASFGVTRVIEATDAVDGLTVLRDPGKTVDFVLVDQEMPVLDGMEFTRLVRKDESLPNPQLPIIMVTGHADKKHVVEARSAGVDGFVAKPFSPEELHEHILAVYSQDRSKPAAPVSDKDDEAKEPARTALGKFDLTKLTFLVIDDSGFSRKMVRRALAAYGAEHVIEREDAVAGLAVLKDRGVPVDMVLVDREMPIFDGIEFTRMVRRDNTLGNPKVPILMVSSYADKAHIVEAKNAGVTGFVAKPFSPEDLYERIQFALGDPRPFIEAKMYVGPDRRWKKKEEAEEEDEAMAANLDGPARRSDDGWEV